MMATRPDPVPQVRHWLYVEDDPSAAVLMRLGLSQVDPSIRLTAVEDGEEAQHLLERHGTYRNAATPELVLLDLGLPRTDGVEFLRRIRALPEYAEVPVIVLSNWLQEPLLTECYRLGANCCLDKPADQRELVSLLRHVSRFWDARVRQ